MSSTKTIGIIGGGQLGQMMAISAIYMGHKVIALDPAADCPASRVARSSWLLIMMWMPSVSWLSVVMSLPMNLKMLMLTVWMLLSRMDNFHKEQTYFVSPKPDL